jgi:catechol 2,3-dioxygenase-like lactoylglutathione lyase family enzyme
MRIRLGHVEIFCADPLASIPFYRDALGFEVVEVQGEKFVWLKSGDSLMLLRLGMTRTPSELYRDTSIAMVIYADDLEAATARLAEHGVAIIGDDGPGCLTFRDPDGHWLQLVEYGWESDSTDSTVSDATGGTASAEVRTTASGVNNVTPTTAASHATGDTTTK